MTRCTWIAASTALAVVLLNSLGLSGAFAPIEVEDQPAPILFSAGVSDADELDAEFTAFLNEMGGAAVFCPPCPPGMNCCTANCLGGLFCCTIVCPPGSTPSCKCTLGSAECVCIPRSQCVAILRDVAILNAVVDVRILRGCLDVINAGTIIETR